MLKPGDTMMRVCSFRKSNFLLSPSSLVFSVFLTLSQVKLLKRHEISEREAHLEDLTADYKKVVEESNQRSKLYLVTVLTLTIPRQ